MHAVKVSGGLEVYLHSFFTSGLDGCGQPNALPLYPGEGDPNFHSTGCWLGFSSGIRAPDRSFGKLVTLSTTLSGCQAKVVLMPNYTPRGE